MTQINQSQKKNSRHGGFVKKLDYNANIAEIDNKIPSIRCLGTTSAWTAVEKKYTCCQQSSQKTDYNTKTSEIEKKKNY